MVPDFAEVYYYARHNDMRVLDGIWERIVNAARGAALGTGHDDGASRSPGAVWNVLPNDYPGQRDAQAPRSCRRLRVHAGRARVRRRSARRSTGSCRRWTPRIRFSRRKVASARPRPTWATSAGACRPCRLTAATWVPGTPAHSWQAVAAGGMSIGAKGMMVAAKTMALTTIDLLTDPAHIEKARAEFDQGARAGLQVHDATGRLANRRSTTERTRRTDQSIRPDLASNHPDVAQTTVRGGIVGSALCLPAFAHSRRSADAAASPRSIDRCASSSTAAATGATRSSSRPRFTGSITCSIRTTRICTFWSRPSRPVVAATNTPFGVIGRGRWQGREDAFASTVRPAKSQDGLRRALVRVFTLMLARYAVETPVGAKLTLTPPAATAGTQTTAARDPLEFLGLIASTSTASSTAKRTASSATSTSTSRPTGRPTRGRSTSTPDSTTPRAIRVE